MGLLLLDRASLHIIMIMKHKDMADKKNNEKPISLDSLAGMIKRGFDGVPTKQEMDHGFAELRHKMKEGFDEVKGDTSHLRASVGQIHQILEKSKPS